MSRDKQIDDIKVIINDTIYSISNEEDRKYLEQILNNAGYRKASDVASDIIGEITRYVNSHQAFLTPIPMSEVIGFGEFLGELEKKYTKQE